MLVLGLVEVPVWVLFTLGTILLLYIVGKRNQDDLKAMGLPAADWSMPLVGVYPTIAKKGLYVYDQEMIKIYGKKVGIMDGRRPAILTTDIPFIKQVTVKEWYNFPNRRPNMVNHEYGLRKMVNVLTDEKWKRLRNTLSPTFSTGKLKKGLMNRSGKQLVENLDKVAKRDGVLEPKKAFGCYTMDVIASTAFGMDINSAKDENNDFIQHAKRFNGLSLTNPLVFVMFFAPRLLKYFCRMGFTLIPKKTTKFFVDVINQAKKTREESGFKRVDFLQLMLNTQKSGGKEESKETEEEQEEVDEEAVENNETEKEENGDMNQQPKLLADVKKVPLDDEEILGNAMVFFAAGYENTATVLSFLCYLLAINTHIQDKLIAQIDTVVGKEEPTYEMIGELDYLDKCLHETQRLYPVLSRVTRHCKHSTTIDGITIPEGCMIYICVPGIHMDPDNYPNPHEFDPERFSSEAKATRDPMTYIPFGVGPRNCLGMRLALLEAKVAMVRILQRMRFVRCEGTQVPLKLRKGTLVAPEKPFQLKLQVRRE